jgi:hypothetical protein
LYFSCKNYQELAQKRIKTVLGYFTTNQKKLVLHFSDFSMIFYAIYKKQEIHFTIGVTTLQESPRKEICFCNVVPGGGRPARVAGIRRARRRSWPGKAWGGAYGPLGSYLGTGLVGRGGR